MALSAPGLKRRTRADGSVAYYWVASAVSRLAGEYPVKTVPLHYDSDEARAIRCNVLTDELRVWLSSAGKVANRSWDGTIAGLILAYQTTDTSPYFSVQENTREDYDYRLRVIEKAVGAVSVASLNAVDFTRWHRNFKKPTETRSSEHVRKAHGLMTMVRMLISFGVSMRYPSCAATLAVLHEMSFEVPKRRKQALTYEQASAVVDLALASRRRSLALGQALQFELAMRQVDVIGRWTKDDGTGGITFHGNRWGDGLLWSHLGDDLTVSKETTKTAADGEWNLADCPLVLKVLVHYPASERVGPMLVSEISGLPYDKSEYAKAWRKIANHCGVPADVWNRDSRAGGITEGWDAGGTEQDLQRLATHSDPAMTRRYARNSLASTTRVAKLRVAGRKQVKNEA